MEVVTQPKYSEVAQVQEDLRAGKISCVQLVEYYLERIKTHQSLNIYLEVYAEEALVKAQAIDAQLQENPDQLGRLFGVVVSLKDVLCYKDHVVTGGSKILTGFTSLFSATGVERVVAEDAIIIGRVNCDEFAMGSTTENSHYGPTRNAADPSRVPGGSSGGSAVAVQADTCLVSLGTDTGGSVRQPASFCGVIGFKPTYGRISRYGLLAYGSSFDQLGVLAQSVPDTALFLEIMAGPDEFDSTASQRPVEAYASQLSFNRPAKVAYFGSALDHPSLDPGVREVCQNLIQKLQAEGHTVEAVDFDYLDYIIPAYYVLTTAEASSNLSRYDGIRYGYRSPAAVDLMETYKKSRTEGFGTEVKRRIMLGTFVLSAGYYDAYYTKAQKARRLIQEKTFEIFEQYDFILLPAAPGPAWKLGDNVDDPVAMYLADVFTVQANMVGIPAICLPVGTHASEGLPVGVQFMANRFQESDLLAFSQRVMAGL